MGLDYRLVADDTADANAWLQAVNTGFLRAARLSEEELAARRERLDISRARGAFEAERCVATFRSFDQRLTVPGGRDVASHAVTGVTVTASHRRRGLLSRMMRDDLGEARERGEAPVSALVAAEYGIYGRFGYGPATTITEWSVNAARSGVDAKAAQAALAPDATGGTPSLAFAEADEVCKAGPELHERFRLLHPGATDRRPVWWEIATGRFRPFPDFTEPFHALYRDGSGAVQGMVTFTTKEGWGGGLPDGTADVSKLIAASPEAERALWFFVLSLDWVGKVTASMRYPDDLLPDLLPEPRAVTVTDLGDFLWIRPLDVPRMLAGRGYRAEGELVVEVSDPLGLCAGRFALTASPEGAQCVPTTRSADLTLGTGALGTLYLGDRPATRLAALGLLDEETPGAAARADLLLGSDRRPWAPDIF